MTDLRREIQDATRSYPDLRISEAEAALTVVGSFPIVEPGNGVLTRFQVALQFPKNYPLLPPNVYETGRRIPRRIDRHMMGADGQCCVIVPEQWLLEGQRRTLLDFLDGPMRNFFLGQALVEQGLPWPFGERGHGMPGLEELYEELLGTGDLTEVEYLLDFLASNPPVKGHWPCRCGSGKIIRKCHGVRLAEARHRIDATSASLALTCLRNRQRAVSEAARKATEPGTS